MCKSYIQLGELKYIYILYFQLEKFDIFVCELRKTASKSFKVIEVNELMEYLGLIICIFQGNGSYKFGYDTRGGDPDGAKFFRHEERDENGQVKGQYGFVDSNNDLHVILYVTDPQGKR